MNPMTVIQKLTVVMTAAMTVVMTVALRTVVAMTTAVTTAVMTVVMTVVDVYKRQAAICVALIVLAIFVFFAVIWPEYKDVPFSIRAFIYGK